MLDFTSPHRRYNPLLGEWILVSPHRTKRPWQGTTGTIQKQELPEYDPTCYLCPGNKRVHNAKNPDYKKTFVFTNDHAALLPHTETGERVVGDHLIVAKNEKGICRVVCYSPSHNRTMADMTVEQIGDIIDTWTTEYATIGAEDHISYVQIFENKGPLMGASNPHPHGQIWANEQLPTQIIKEHAQQKTYWGKHGRPLLLDYWNIEQQEAQRVVYQNDTFVVLVPFWATWPYETMILPKIHMQSFKKFTQSDTRALADALKKLTVGYDKLFSTSFPYSMGIHQAPTDEKDHPEWQWHMHFYPPLLRSAVIKKYYVGYEMFAEAQRDINPEDAAASLKNLS